jgi:hypothetical protein
MPRAVFIWSFLAVLAMALSLGPSFAHLLEAPPRLNVWAPVLWREATVFNGQFEYFAVVGAPLEIATLILGAILTFVLRRERPAFWLALAATLLYAVSLATWFSVVEPMNAILAQWQPGPIPENFEAVRNQWETGHIVISAIKTAGLSCAIAGVLSIGRDRTAAA